MTENEPKAPPHWSVRLFFALTVAGVIAVAFSYILPLLTGADPGAAGDYTRTPAIIVAVVGLVGVLVTSALLGQRGRRG